MSHNNRQNNYHEEAKTDINPSLTLARALPQKIRDPDFDHFICSSGHVADNCILVYLIAAQSI